MFRAAGWLKVGERAKLSAFIVPLCMCVFVLASTSVANLKILIHPLGRGFSCCVYFVFVFVF